MGVRFIQVWLLEGSTQVYSELSAMYPRKIKVTSWSCTAHHAALHHTAQNWATNWWTLTDPNCLRLSQSWPTHSICSTSFDKLSLLGRCQETTYEFLLCGKTLNQNWFPCQVETIQYQWSSHRWAGRTGPWGKYTMYEEQDFTQWVLKKMVLTVWPVYDCID